MEDAECKAGSRMARLLSKSNALKEDLQSKIVWTVKALDEIAANRVKLRYT